MSVALVLDAPAARLREGGSNVDVTTTQAVSRLVFTAISLGVIVVCYQDMHFSVYIVRYEVASNILPLRMGQ
jgi:hypothetical protein